MRRKTNMNYLLRMGYRYMEDIVNALDGNSLDGPLPPRADDFIRVSAETIAPMEPDDREQYLEYVERDVFRAVHNRPDALRLSPMRRCQDTPCRRAKAVANVLCARIKQQARELPNARRMY